MLITLLLLFLPLMGTCRESPPLVAGCVDPISGALTTHANYTVEYYQYRWNTLGADHIKITDPDDPRIGAVKLLKSSSGIIAYRFFYHPTSTDVFDASDNKITYHFTQDGHLHTIERLFAQTLYHKEVITPSGSLIYDKEGTLLFEGEYVEPHLPMCNTPTDTYDALGRCLSHTDPDGNTIHYTYDTHSHLRSVIHPDGTRTTYDYAPDGTLKKTTHPDGTYTLHTPNTQTHYTQDNRPLSQTTTIGNTETTTEDDLITTKTYDLSHHLIEEIAQDQNGSLLSKVTYAYDAAGNRTHVTRFIQGKPATEITLYDPFNRPIERIDPEGNIITPDTSPTPTQAPLPTDPNLTATYDKRGRRLTLTLPDHSSIHYTYDPLYLRSIARYDANNTLLYTHTFTEYDLSGHLLQETPIADIGPTLYTYTLSGRPLTITSPFFTQIATYDPHGHITSTHIKTPFFDQTLTYTPTPHKETFPFDIVYDAPNTLRILRPNTHIAIAIEIDTVPYLPIHDLFGNTVALVHPRTKQIVTQLTKNTNFENVDVRFFK